MGKVLRRHPQVVAYAIEALKRAGYKTPLQRAIRGGTDGSRLSYMGLPVPIFLPANTPSNSKTGAGIRAGHGKSRRDHPAPRFGVGRAQS